MKMLKHFFGTSFILVCFTLVAISCSGGGNELTADTKITGPLGKFFEVVDKNYKILEDESSVRISIQIKRISEGGPKDASWESRPEFKIEVLDSDDDLITSDATHLVFDEKQLNAIFALGVGETTNLTFTFDEKKLENAHKVKVSSVWNEDKENNSSEDIEVGDSGDSDVSSSYSSSSSDGDDSDLTSSSSSSSSGSTDWDEVLDSYERYVDKYVALAKKAKNGDIDALNEYNECMQEAIELNEKLSSAKGELSVNQVARLNKITLKMSKVAM